MHCSRCATRKRAGATGWRVEGFALLCPSCSALLATTLRPLLARISN